MKIFAPVQSNLVGKFTEIECDISGGLPGFVVFGIADKARERVRSAIRTSGLGLPAKRLTLNLAPADIP